MISFSSFIFFVVLLSCQYMYRLCHSFRFFEEKKLLLLCFLKYNKVELNPRPPLHRSTDRVLSRRLTRSYWQLTAVTFNKPPWKQNKITSVNTQATATWPIQQMVHTRSRTCTWDFKIHFCVLATTATRDTRAKCRGRQSAISSHNSMIMLTRWTQKLPERKVSQRFFNFCEKMEMCWSNNC